MPTICVGNIEAGGTGKTPFVALLAKLLSRQKKLAILSRGYGRKSGGFIEVSDTSMANEVGDEPLLLKLTYPHLPVAVCENRLLGIEKLIALHPDIELVVLDDAFQHRWLKPDISIITTSAHAPYWTQWPLPGGNLRGPISSTGRASAVVITGSEPHNNINPPNHYGPIFQSKSRITGPFTINGQRVEVGKVVTFCGIANAGRFIQAAQNMALVAQSVVFADHHLYSVEDLDRLATLVHSFGRDHWLLTTEKDHVRLLGHPALHKIAERLVFLRLEATLSHKQEQELTELIDKKCWKK